MIIPIPPGLELPAIEEGETIELTATFALTPEGLALVAIDGVALSDTEEAPEPEETDEDFVTAVNRQIK